MERLSNKTKNIYQLITSFLFLSMITIPLLGFLLKIDPRTPSIENRELAAKPNLQLNLQSIYDFSKNYPKYFNDHFGFRHTLIYLHSLIKYNVFETSPTDRVELGSSNWLYLKNFGFNFLDYYRNKNLLTDQELLAWQKLFEKRRDWLAQRGIVYYVVIAPNKSTIYPEYVPPKYNKVFQQSRLDQLLKYLQSNSDVNFIDVRPELIKNKADFLLYWPNDTHWNSVGAYFAYQKIINTLSAKFPNLVSLSIDKDIRLDTLKHNGDLGQMIALGEELSEKLPNITIINPTAKLSDDINFGIDIPKDPNIKPFATEINNLSLPKTVIFRDSFSTTLQPLLSENFSRAAYIWQNEFDSRVIDQENPHLVINIFVERNLSLPPPQDFFSP